MQEILLDVIGYIAGVCLAVAQFPQAYLVYRTNDTKGISLLMFSILTTGIFFWFLYGIIASVTPMWLTNGICLMPSFYILYKCIKNKRKTTNNKNIK